MLSHRGQCILLIFIGTVLRVTGIHLRTPKKRSSNQAPPPKNSWSAWLARLPGPEHPDYNETLYNRTGFCRFDAKEEWDLLIDSPWPTGEVQTIYLPNDSTPGLELSLAVRGDEDKYPYHVPPRAYGGRRIDCLMPQPNEDNDAAMTKLSPVCTLSDPPKLKCTVCDAWLEKAPGGPLHELIASATQFGSGPPPGTTVVALGGATVAAPSNGTRDLYLALQLLDKFRAIEKEVKVAKYREETFSEERKSTEEKAKNFVSAMKARRDLYSSNGDFKTRESGRKFSGGGNADWELRPKSVLWVETLVNASIAAEKRLKADNKRTFELLHDAEQRWKTRRKTLTEQWLGVEELDVNTRDVWGRTPLHWAAAEGQELLQHLVHAGRDPQNKKAEEDPSLAAEEAAIEPVKQQLSVDGGIAIPEHELDALRAPKRRDWTTFVRGLLDRGAEPNICDVDGRTPLDLAVTVGNAGSVQALLQAGAARRGGENRWGHDIDDIAYHPKIYPKLDADVFHALGLPVSRRNETSSGAPLDLVQNGTIAGTDSHEAVSTNDLNARVESSVLTSKLGA